MPNISRLASFSFSVENFLDACSPTELKEVDVLIQSARYRNKMNSKAKKVTHTAEDRDEIKAHGFDDAFLLGEK